MDLTQKKEQFASQMVALAGQVLLAAEDIEAMDAAYSVNGFNTGGANAFVDADFNQSNKHLTAAIVADVMFALGTINGALTDGIKNSLRKGLPGGLPD